MDDEVATSTRKREYTAPDIISKRGGVFWGAVILLVGVLWFLDVMDVINLSEKFAEAILPLLFIVGGIYLLAMKMGR
jgi:hypothetical protein